MLIIDIPVELYPMAFVVGAACVGAGFGKSSQAPYENTADSSSRR